MCEPTHLPDVPLFFLGETFAVPVGHAGFQPELLADAVQWEEHAKVETLKHTTLATARLRFLFLAAKIWRHAGRVGQL